MKKQFNQNEGRRVINKNTSTQKATDKPNHQETQAGAERGDKQDEPTKRGGNGLN